jgi:hypothetical protein
VPKPQVRCPFGAKIAGNQPVLARTPPHDVTWETAMSNTAIVVAFLVGAALVVLVTLRVEGVL